MKATKRRTAGRKPVQYIFTGSDKRFVKTKTWTINELAKIVGISTTSMLDRVAGQKNITDKDVRPSKKSLMSSVTQGNFEVTRESAGSLSSKWLRMKIVSNSSLQ